MKDKIAVRGSLATRWVIGSQRALLIVFGLCTLLMPLLYLQVNYFVAAAIMLALFMATVGKYHLTQAYSRTRRIVAKHPSLVIFIVALITRLIWVVIVSAHTKQVSDFLNVYTDSLQSVPSSRHVPIWTHYITYPFILHYLVAAFGRSTLVGGVFNAVVCSVSVLLTYWVGSSVANKKTGFAAAGLMVLWPSMSAYTSIYSPDHLSICFMLLSVLCFVKLLVAKRVKPAVMYAAACAVSLWALGFFKDIVPILVIAFTIAAVIFVAASGRLKNSLVTIYCVLGLYIITALAGATHIPLISAIAGKPVNPSLVSYFIYTGLGGNDTGSWQPEIMNHYTQLIERDKYDYDRANGTMLHEALSRVQHRLPEIPATIWNKSRTVQADDTAKISWVEASAESAGSLGLRDTLQAIIEPLNGVFFASIIMLIGAGVYYLWRERSGLKLMLLVIICIGYSGLLLIIEAQNRYRYIIEPLYCILAAYGLVGLCKAYTTSSRTSRGSGR